MAYAKALFFFLLINLLTVSFCDDAAVMSKLLAALSPTPSGWSTSRDPCAWDYVSCKSGNVVTINLDSQSISGELPSEITQLASLQVLSVEQNFLSGPLPSFANMSSLVELYLDNNEFSSIPKDFLLGLPNLRTFSISDNALLGPWQIPSYLSESTSLGSFYASNASIDGLIPNFFDSLPNLHNLRLSYNNLTGSLPGSFGSSGIQNLWVNNQLQGLSGTIDVISSMTQLSQVWLHDNAFTGQIPNLSECENLFDLQLKNNQFTGVVPSSIMTLPKLVNITLQNNNLQGPMPQFRESVKTIDLGNNGFCKNTPGPCDQQVTTLLDVAGGLGYPITLAQSWKGNYACNWLSISCDAQGNVITVALTELGLSATGRATNKIDVYAFGVVLMEIITGKKAVDETLPDETCHLVTWFHKIIRKGHNLRNAIDPTLDLDDQTFESISKVAELAAHCTANKYFQRPTMEHVVNVLGPFAQKWKPLRLEEIEEKYGGLDLHMSLPLAFDDSSIESLSFTEAKLNGHRLNQSAQF
nr:receptor-like kinase TMK4 [Ipomoea trifida]